MSDAANAARRRNAAFSTGPRTPRGKVNSSVNALKHGLSVSSYSIPMYRDRVEDLTGALYGDAIHRLSLHASAGASVPGGAPVGGEGDDALRKACRRIAEAQVDLERARFVRVAALLDARRALPVPTSRDITNALGVVLLDKPKTKKRNLSCFRLLNWKADLSGICQLEDIAIAGSLLNGLERYEDRACSRLRTATRDYDALMEERTIDAYRDHHATRRDADRNKSKPDEACSTPSVDAWVRSAPSDSALPASPRSGQQSGRARSPGIASSPFGSLTPREPRYPPTPGIPMQPGTPSRDAYPAPPPYRRRGTGPGSRHAFQTGHALAVWPLSDPSQEARPPAKSAKARKASSRKRGARQGPPSARHHYPRQPAAGSPGAAHPQAPPPAPSGEELVDAIRRALARNASRPDQDPVVQLPTGDERIGHGRGEPDQSASHTNSDERLGHRPGDPNPIVRPPPGDERLGRRPDDAGGTTHRRATEEMIPPPAGRRDDPYSYYGQGRLQNPIIGRPSEAPPPTFSDDVPETRGSSSSGTPKDDAPEHGAGTHHDPYIRRRT